jgi:hypothetical protein
MREARYERGRLLLERGKEGQARRDLELGYADDPHFRDIAPSEGLVESLSNLGAISGD